MADDEFSPPQTHHQPPLFTSRVLRGHELPVYSVAFSPDGKWIVSSSADKMVRLWDTIGEPIGKPFQGHRRYVSSVAFSPDSQTIVSGGEDRTLRLWDLDGNPIREPFQGHSRTINWVAFSPDGQRIVSASMDGTIRLWDLDGNPIREPFQGHSGSVLSVAFSPDSQTIVSGDSETVRLWDLEGNLIGKPFQGYGSTVWSVAFSPNGQTIVSGYGDKIIRLWDLQGNLIAASFQGHEDSILSVSFSPDGQTIVSSSRDKTIRLWDLQGNSVAEPLQVHEGDVWSVAFSPDGQTIASGSADGTIRLWFRLQTTFVPASICNDLPEGKDTLQIEDELTALATVLMLRQLQPPVAVGILGSWGSGKSFAMHLIRQQINAVRSERLTAQQAWGDEQDENHAKKLSPYVGHIYQIQFNAWTYVRSNLWASLMQEIFYELNRQLTLEQHLKKALEAADPPQSLLVGGNYWQALYALRPEEQQALLLEKGLNPKAWENLQNLSNSPDATENILWSALSQLRQEERKQLQATENQIKQEQADLEAKQQQIEQAFEYKKNRQEKIARWRAFEARMALLFLELLQVREQSGKLPKESWQANFALRIFQLQPEDTTDDTTTDSEATADPGADPEATATAEEPEDKTSTVQTELDAFLSEVKKLNGIERVTPFSLRQWIAHNLVFCVLFVASIVLLSLAIQDLPDLLNSESPNWAHRFWNLLGGLVILLPTLFQILSRIGKLVGDYQTSVKSQLERIQKRQEVEREDRLAAEGVPAQIEAIDQLKLQAEQLRQKVGLTANYDSLMSLMQERLDGKTYSEHLGLMEQVRRDLLDLSDRLTTLPPPEDRDRRQAFETYFPRGPVRVVLYIDDLDRCPPKRVVEVLETVQLLLKTRLFIVILAIDDRYIARALEQVYTGVLKRRGKPSGIDYLEKIIQIPYRMRPISPLNVESYLDAQTQPRKVQEPLETEFSSAEDFSEISQNETPVQTTATAPESTHNNLEDAEVAVDQGSVTETAEATQSAYLETIAEVTEFEEWEFQLLVACCQHVDITPRTAKRLINIYKILKIVWQNRPAPEEQPPQERERVTIALLALSGRYPDFMRTFFEELATRFEEQMVPSDKNPQLQVSAHKITQELEPQIPPKDYHAKREWRRFKSDLKRTLFDLVPEDLQLSLAELHAKNPNLDTFRIDYPTFHLALSFCFVGDLGYDPDDYAQDVYRSDE
ncbi:MAG: P-loop NTPase fold protein [Cyanobacteria bacterium J06639_14]